jgi:hypothetical protein
MLRATLGPRNTERPQDWSSLLSPPLSRHPGIRSLRGKFVVETSIRLSHEGIRDVCVDT